MIIYLDWDFCWQSPGLILTKVWGFTFPDWKPPSWLFPPGRLINWCVISCALWHCDRCGDIIVFNHGQSNGWLTVALWQVPVSLTTSGNTVLYIHHSHSHHHTVSVYPPRHRNCYDRLGWTGNKTNCVWSSSSIIKPTQISVYTSPGQWTHTALALFSWHQCSVSMAVSCGVVWWYGETISEEERTQCSCYKLLGHYSWYVW